MDILKGKIAHRTLNILRNKAGLNVASYSRVAHIELSNGVVLGVKGY